MTLYGLSPVFYERGVDIKNEFERFTIALREVLRNA